MRRSFRARVTLPVSLAWTLAGGIGCGSGPGATPAGRKDPVPVVVASVTRRDVPRQIRAIGTVEAYSNVTLKPQVDGQLAAVHFREGQAVEVGDLLFTIDVRPFEAELHQAAATLARDRAESDNAAVAARRRGRLIEKGFLSRDENDQAHAHALALAAAVKADEAAVEAARLRLEWCAIRSPIGGRIGRVLSHEGNVVKARETALAEINQVRPVNVAFAVPERDLPDIRERAAAGTLAVDAFVGGRAEVAATGELRFIDNEVDKTTGTVLLKGWFSNEDEALWPGQFVDVALTLSVDVDATLAPVPAIQVGQQGPYAFVVEADSTVSMRPVVVGRTVGVDVIVQQGLQAGERVVTEGHLRLAPGFAVEIKNGGSGPTTPPRAS